jgi:hypothetical protein
VENGNREIAVCDPRRDAAIAMIGADSDPVLRPSVHIPESIDTDADAPVFWPLRWVKPGQIAKADRSPESTYCRGPFA